MSLLTIFIVVAAVIVTLALLIKGDVRAAIKMPWGFAFDVEAKDRRSNPRPVKKPAALRTGPLPERPRAVIPADSRKRVR
jgi:hypothetical protein